MSLTPGTRLGVYEILAPLAHEANKAARSQRAATRT
jgi:hypothetical protein